MAYSFTGYNGLHKEPHLFCFAVLFEFLYIDILFDFYFLFKSLSSPFPSPGGRTVRILPRTGCKLHSSQGMSTFQEERVQLCQKLLIQERSNRSQGFNFISQLTQKLQVCFVFMKNLHLNVSE